MAESANQKPHPPGETNRGETATDAQPIPAIVDVFGEILDDLPALICRFQPDGTITYVNEAYCTFFERSRAELIGTDFRLLIPVEDREGVMESIRSLTPENLTQSHEHPVLAPGQEVRWQQWTNRLLLDEAGIVTGYQSIGQDVTELKRAEQIARQNEQRHRALLSDVLDTSHAGIIILDQNRHVVWTNQAWERFFGLRRRDVLGDDIRALIGDRATEIFANPEAVAPNSHADDDAPPCEEPIECHVRPGDGREERWLELKSSPITAGLFAGGRIEHYYDITPRKRGEAERLDLERRMQHRQKLESLGLMAGGMAHDFNNALMVIQGNAELALQDTLEDAASYDSIREIQYGAQRAAGLAGQLLAYSGRGRVVSKPVSLSDLLIEIEPMLRISASREVRFELNLPRNLPTMHGDPTQLRQIAMNLVANAAEAIGDTDGSLSIRTGLVDGEEQADQHVFLEVADTGCGMDTEVVQRIFDPFFTTKFTGRGLGMAAVMGIVRDHHGTIDIQSKPGVGTTIRILFPTANGDVDEAGTAQSLETENERRGTPHCVLLVDDEDDVRAITQSMLECFGLEVLTATDGIEAIEIFRERAHDIDLVLLDLTMPRLGGEETYRELRAIRPDVSIILTSGYSEQDLGERFADRPGTNFVQKPYCFATLKAVLDRSYRM